MRLVTPCIGYVFFPIPRAEASPDAVCLCGSAWLEMDHLRPSSLPLDLLATRVIQVVIRL